jgi:hypothetical protein
MEGTVRFVPSAEYRTSAALDGRSVSQAASTLDDDYARSAYSACTNLRIIYSTRDQLSCSINANRVFLGVGMSWVSRPVTSQEDQVQEI